MMLSFFPFPQYVCVCGCVNPLVIRYKSSTTPTCLTDNLQLGGESAQRVASSGEVFTRLVSLHLRGAKLDADSALLLSLAVRASQRSLATLQLLGANVRDISFLRGCRSLRVLGLGGAPPLANILGQTLIPDNCTATKSFINA